VSFELEIEAVAPPSAEIEVEFEYGDRPAPRPSSDSILRQVQTAAGHVDSAEVEVEPLLPDRVAAELPKIPMFSDLPRDAFVALSRDSIFRRFAHGETIIQQGTVGDSFFAICEGTVRVERAEAGRVLDLSLLREGSFFGEIALLSGGTRNASVVADSDEVQLLEFPGQLLKRLAAQYDSLGTALNKFCRQRLLSNLVNVAPVFRPFALEQRRALVQRFRAKDWRDGELLLGPGLPAGGLYVVLYGEIAIRVGTKVVAVLREGEAFDARTVAERAKGMPASVVALRSSSTLRLPEDDYAKLKASNPTFDALVHPAPRG
jgi:CRP-like cAMP-binding protein